VPEFAGIADSAARAEARFKRRIIGIIVCRAD
jgi:hypothetical protein